MVSAMAVARLTMRRQTGVAAYVEKLVVEDLETKGFLPKGAAE